MITASQLRSGMAIRYDGQLYKAISADYHPGQGKMGGVTHARLQNLSTGTLWEHSFRAELKLEDMPVERQSMSFLYSDAGECWFMNPETYEQVSIPAKAIGAQAAFLRPEMQLPVEFVDGQPVSVSFPEILDVRIADTAPPIHQQQDNTLKPASLENGVEVMVPQFIKPGDLIRLDMQTLKYLERTRGAGR
ncbi:MAG TPA: elongation factor P [Bryobacteraceae bacterium]|nr:elongation factor P [Bryobacteraceae bacterium]